MSSIFDKIIPGRGKDKDKKEQKTKEEKQEQKKEEQTPKKETRTATKPKKEKTVRLGGFSGETLIEGPWITEKSRDQEQKGKYTFRVKPRANKSEIRKEIEQRYDVTVLKVNMSSKITRPKRFRNQYGKGEFVKKAIVTLKEGDKIEIFPV